MKIRSLAISAAATTTAGLLLALSGCGGGGGGSAAPGGGNPLAAGRSALNELANGQTATTSTTLNSALTLFQQASAADPNSSEAAFGTAVLLVGNVTEGIDGDAVGPIAMGGSGSGSAGSAGAARATRRDVSSGGSTGGSSGSTGPGDFTPPAPPTDGVIVPGLPGAGTAMPIPADHTLGLLWFLDRSLSNPNTLLHMLAPISDLRVGLVPFYGYSSDNQDIPRRLKMLDTLTQAAALLQKVEADPNFSISLPAPDQANKSVVVGVPEANLFEAYVQSLRVSLALSLAYVRDPGANGLLPPPAPVVGGVGSGTGDSTTASPPAPPIFGRAALGRADVTPTIPPSPFQFLDKDHNGVLTPDEYMPPSPFLTLRDSTLLKTAQLALYAVADRESKGVAGVMARPAAGAFLVPNTPAMQPLLVNLRDKVIPVLQKAVTGPITLDVPRYQPIPLVAVGGGKSLVAPQISAGAIFSSNPSGPDAPPMPPQVTTDSVTINLAAWFANPPADLKVFAPTYYLDSIGYPDFRRTTYPDPTFGGLFPNGLPEALRL